MKTRRNVDYLRITGILVLVTIILASSSAYNLNDNADRSYSWTKTAGQEQGFEEQDNSIDENSVTTNNINSSGLSLPELFSKVEKSVVGC